MQDEVLRNMHSKERRNRIRLSIAAYAYEIRNKSIMSDHEFDSLAKKINVNEPTFEDYYTKEYREKCIIIDEFFKKEFSASTGQWIYKHPFFDEVAGKYFWLYEND